MHHTFEEIQRSATPLVDGPLKVYLVLVALLLTVSAHSLLAHGVAVVLFGGLTIHAVGTGPVRWVGLPVSFLLPGIAVILVFTSGEPIAEWWLFSVSEAGLVTATETLSRSVAALAVLSFLVLSTPVPAVVASIRQLPVPTIVVELFVYVYRAIQVLFEESIRMRTAATARAGFNSRRSTYRTVKLIASTLLVRAFDRIERFGDSMRARNYDGRLPVVDTFESTGHAYAVTIVGILILVRLI